MTVLAPLSIPGHPFLPQQSPVASSTSLLSPSLKRTFEHISSIAPRTDKPLTSLTRNLARTYLIIQTKQHQNSFSNSASTEHDDSIFNARILTSLFHKQLADTRISLNLPPLSFEDRSKIEFTSSHYEALHIQGFSNPSLIGRSLTCLVFKCRNQTNKTDYAIKTSNSQRINTLIAQELNTLKYIKSRLTKNKLSYIIETGDFFLLQNRIAYPMELCITDLHHFIDSTQEISLLIIKHAAKQMFHALSSLKAIHLFHADIKPGNIFIKSGSPFQLKLADFGLAQIAPVTTHLLLQTLPYRSPELILQSLPYECSSDMWSLGCVLMELRKACSYLFNVTEEEQEPTLLTKQQSLLGPYPDPLPSKYPSQALQKSIAAHINEIPLSAQDTERSKDNLIDLIEKMLTFRPKERISPEKALKHPFVL